MQEKITADFPHKLCLLLSPNSKTCLPIKKKLLTPALSIPLHHHPLLILDPCTYHTRLLGVFCHAPHFFYLGSPSSQNILSPQPFSSPTCSKTSSWWVLASSISRLCSPPTYPCYILRDPLSFSHVFCLLLLGASPVFSSGEVVSYIYKFWAPGSCLVLRPAQRSQRRTNKALRSGPGSSRAHKSHQSQSQTQVSKAWLGSGPWFDSFLWNDG